MSEMDNEGWTRTNEIRLIKNENAENVLAWYTLQQRWSRPRPGKDTMDYEWRDVPIEDKRTAEG